MRQTLIFQFVSDAVAAQTGLREDGVEATLHQDREDGTHAVEWTTEEPLSIVACSRLMRDYQPDDIALNAVAD